VPLLLSSERFVMRQTLSALFVLLILSCTPPLSAQDQKTPKPEFTVEDVKGFRTEGRIANVLAGEAVFVRNKRSAQLKPQQTLDDGDTVLTAKDARVEILLNPGIYLRLSSNTVVRFLDFSPDNLKLKLLSGSIILEILVTPFELSHPSYNEVRGQFSAGYQTVTVSAPGDEFVTTRGGIYRCNAGEYRHSILRVTKGFAVVRGNVVGNGMECVMGDRVPTVRKFEKGEEDSFDRWSQERAAALIASNKSLRNTGWDTKLRKNPNANLEIMNKEESTRLKERFTVSALGGLVGYAENDVLHQTGDSDWQPLKEGDQLEYGDRIKTGSDGRVEIRLYPACYLMLAESSELIYGSREDGGAAPKLLRGSAIIVSTIQGEEGSLVTLVAPEGEIALADEGFYRLNVKPGRESEILVYDGTIKIGDRQIQRDNRVVFQGKEFGIAPIRRMDLDAFELWSRKRSALLSSRTAMADPTASAHRVERTGMWYLDQANEAYTFVPGAREFSSPYGGKYSVRFAGRRR
jgi:hypothetical protein